MQHGELPADRLARALLARATRLAAGIAAVPLIVGFAGAQRVAGAVHDLAARRVPAGPEHPPAPPAVGADASTAFARVEAIPFAPAPGAAGRMIRAGFPDWPLMVLSSKPEFAQLGFRYGRAFRPLVLPGAGGEPIAALVAVRPSAPAVVVVHGAMTTKHFDYVRRLATRLHAAGFSVVAIDQRGFGGTALASEAPNSLGFHEGEDVVAIAGWLRGRGATTVGAVGFSLGGAAVLNAARVSSERAGGLDGGVLALSPPADMARITERASRRPAVRDRFFPTWLTLEAAATGRARAVGLGHGRVTPAEAVERFAAPWYGLEAAAFYDRASAVGFIGAVTVPTLVLHAEDDVVVPVEHAHALRAAAAGNDRVRVLVVPAGGHTAFDAVDPVWMHAVELAWFGTLARYPV